MIGVYKITNTVNGCFYIGSSFNILKRWDEHKKSLRRNKHYNYHLQNSWNKNGESAFRFDVVELCETTEEAIRKEQKLIDYALDNGKTCFNIVPVRLPSWTKSFLSDRLTGGEASRVRELIAKKYGRTLKWREVLMYSPEEVAERTKLNASEIARMAGRKELANVTNRRT